jgi:hypothetical protein
VKVYVCGPQVGPRLDYPRVVSDLLELVAPEHLAGIASVTVSGDPPLDDDDEVLGQYYERYEGDPAVIVVYLETMKREAPALFRLFPVTWKYLIAQTLYHEVGHHYQRYSHGIAKGRQEDHAEAYGQALTRRAFPKLSRLIDGADRFGDWWNDLMIAALTRVVKVWPRARLHYKLGWRHWRREEWSLVVGHWKRALEIDPWFEPAQRALPSARALEARHTRRARAAAAYQRPRTQPVRAHAGRRRRKGRRR